MTRFVKDNYNIASINNIIDKVASISKRLEETDKPIFIELVGTPKSGKTTLKKYLSNFFKKYGVNYKAHQETAEYNPIKDKGSKQYDIWMVMELLRNITEDLSQNEGKIIIFDRGILDRIPWMKYDIDKGLMTQRDLERVTSMYDLSALDEYRPITQIFKTSPKLSVKRKGEPGFFVNEENMEKFNGFLDESMDSITSRTSYSNFIITDQYQDNIKKFTMDCTNNILDGINQELDRRDELKKKQINKEER